MILSKLFKFSVCIFIKLKLQCPGEKLVNAMEWYLLLLLLYYCYRSNCQHLLDHWKSERVPEKTYISALLTMPKPLTVWITINCGIFWKRWAYQTTWPASWETWMQVRKQQLEKDIEQQTGLNKDRSTPSLYIVTLFI